MKSIRKNSKSKPGLMKESEIKPVKKLPVKSKFNVKSSKFWEELYEDDPELDNLQIGKK